MNTLAEPSASLMEAIRRGGALLDEKEPGWRDRIAPGDLEMSLCSRCILGQAFGIGKYQASTYSYRLSALGVGLFNQVTFGFSIDPDVEYVSLESERRRWDELRDAWIGFLKGDWE